MKPWMLDALTGLVSLLVFILMVVVLPAILGGGAGYLGALIVFIIALSGAGTMISRHIG